MGKFGKNEPPRKKARVEKPSTKYPVPRVKGSRAPSAVHKTKSAVSLKEPPPKGKGKEREKDHVRLHTPPPNKIRAKSISKPGGDTARSLPSTFKVIAGSYEKLLYGLEGTVTLDEASKPQFHLKPIFMFPAHVSCIKSVAASPGGGKWLATGSDDEIIKVWDLRRKKEVGGLMHHQGSCVSGLFSFSYAISQSRMVLLQVQ
jgi:protein MAK11